MRNGINATAVKELMAAYKWSLDDFYLNFAAYVKKQIEFGSQDFNIGNMFDNMISYYLSKITGQNKELLYRSIKKHYDNYFYQNVKFLNPAFIEKLFNAVVDKYSV